MKDNVLALKKLAVAVLGGDLTVDKVPGETIAEVIEYIAEKYKAPTSTTE